MSAIAFRRIAPDESRIYRDGDHVGDVYRQDDVLSPGSHIYVVHLDEEHVAARDMLRRSRTACVAIGATRTTAT